MRLLLYSFFCVFVGLLLLPGCNKDDVAQDQNNCKLISIHYFDTISLDEVIDSFEYNGNRLVKKSFIPLASLNSSYDTFYYDRYGKLSMIYRYGSPSNPGLYERDSFIYDAQNRLYKVYRKLTDTLLYPSSTIYPLTYFYYDVNNRLVGIKDSVFGRTDYYWRDMVYTANNITSINNTFYYNSTSRVEDPYVFEYSSYKNPYKGLPTALFFQGTHGYAILLSENAIVRTKTRFVLTKEVGYTADPQGRVLTETLLYENFPGDLYNKSIFNYSNCE